MSHLLLRILDAAHLLVLFICCIFRKKLKKVIALAYYNKGIYSAIMDPSFPSINQLNFDGAIYGLKAIAHPGRLKILCALLGGDLTVSELVNRIQLSQSAVSQHLARMKAAGILIDRRSGNQVYYSLKEQGFKDLVNSICHIYNNK